MRRLSSLLLPVLLGGCAGASVTHLDATGAARLLDREDVRVLDVRTPAEYAAGRLPGATNVDFKKPDFEERLARYPREARYLVYCRSGRRSTRSLAAFEKLGFQHVWHLDGGILAWREGKFPVAK